MKFVSYLPTVRFPNLNLTCCLAHVQLKSPFFLFLSLSTFACRLTMKSVLASVFSMLRGSPLGDLGSNDQLVLTPVLLPSSQSDFYSDQHKPFALLFFFPQFLTSPQGTLRLTPHHLSATCLFSTAMHPPLAALPATTTLTTRSLFKRTRLLSPAKVPSPYCL